MSLQCSRFLIKSAVLVRANKDEVKGSVRYLLDPEVASLPFKVRHWMGVRKDEGEGGRERGVESERERGGGRESGV
jgi:hypothetical protein